MWAPCKLSCHLVWKIRGPGGSLQGEIGQAGIFHLCALGITECTLQSYQCVYMQILYCFSFVCDWICFYRKLYTSCVYPKRFGSNTCNKLVLLQIYRYFISYLKILCNKFLKFSILQLICFLFPQLNFL